MADNQQQAPPAPAPTVPQGNFLARISIAPALMTQYAPTADKLQVALDEALQKLFQFQKTVGVTVTKIDEPQPKTK